MILEKLNITPKDFTEDVDPTSRVGGIFTDGLYKITNLTRKSLIVPMDTLRRQGESDAAVVRLGTPEHWRTAPVRIHRIIPAVASGEMDAFCSELMGTIMGTRVAEGLPYHVTLYSDCMAAIARENAALAPGTRAMGHLRNGPICDVLCQQFRVMNRLIKWIKAHPGK
jgi:hypothetical protein